MREYRRDGDAYSDGQGSDDDGAYMGEESADAFEQGYEEDTEDDAEVPQEGNPRAKAAMQNAPRGVQWGGLDLTRTASPPPMHASAQAAAVPRHRSVTRQHPYTPHEQRMPVAASDDGPSDVEEDEVEEDEERPSFRGAAPASHGYNPGNNRGSDAGERGRGVGFTDAAAWQDAPLRQYPLDNGMHEQGLASDRSDIVDPYASEYSERFQNPANWSPLRPAALMGR